MLVKQNFGKFTQRSHARFTHNAQKTNHSSNIAVVSEDTTCICRNNNNNNNNNNSLNTKPSGTVKQHASVNVLRACVCVCTASIHVCQRGHVCLRPSHYQWSEWAPAPTRGQQKCGNTYTYSTSGMNTLRNVQTRFASDRSHHLTQFVSNILFVCWKTKQHIFCSEQSVSILTAQSFDMTPHFLGQCLKKKKQLKESTRTCWSSYQQRQSFSFARNQTGTALNQNERARCTWSRRQSKNLFSHLSILSYTVTLSSLYTDTHTHTKNYSPLFYATVFLWSSKKLQWSS